VSARSASGGTNLPPQQMGLHRKGLSETFSYADLCSSAELITIDNSFMLVKSFQNKELQQTVVRGHVLVAPEVESKDLLTPSPPLWDNQAA
jgi:hypothetical protein